MVLDNIVKNPGASIPFTRHSLHSLENLRLSLNSPEISLYQLCCSSLPVRNKSSIQDQSLRVPMDLG